MSNNAYVAKNAYLAKVDWLTSTFRTSGSLVGGMAGLKDALLSFFNDEQDLQFVAVPLGHSYYNYEIAFRLVRPAFGGESVHAGFLAFTEKSEFKTKFNQGLILDLSGVGCHKIDFAYLFKLFAPLQPRITRVDFAIDYYDGEVSEDDIYRWFYAGCFAGKRGVHPTIGTISRCDIDGSKSDGTTLYVGNRGASPSSSHFDVLINPVLPLNPSLPYKK